MGIDKVAALIVVWSVTTSAWAGPVAIQDLYYGAEPTSGSYGDVIAAANDPRFDIQGALVDQSGNKLIIDIFTNFAGNAGIFRSLTSDPRGIASGDLFLSGSWDPVGSEADHYANDNYANGTRWAYGFSLDNRWEREHGKLNTGVLYDLSGDDYHKKLTLTDDIMGGGIYRSGQEFSVNLTGVNSSGDVLGNGTWLVDTDNHLLHFEIDVSRVPGLNLGNGVALHWGMSCGNDVIEGFARDAGFVPPLAGAVSAPATVFLFGLGLTGLGFARRARGPLGAQRT